MEYKEKIDSSKDLKDFFAELKKRKIFPYQETEMPDLFVKKAKAWIDSSTPLHKAFISVCLVPEDGITNDYGDYLDVKLCLSMEYLGETLVIKGTVAGGTCKHFYM